ncbi:MAG: YfhO family protein [Desulfobacterales bacterium]|nr:YfhO family protein [Desulfobacterales bacterium]
MFLYLKEIGLKEYSSLIGAVAWMFNGYVMVWFEFEHGFCMYLAATLPAFLYFFELWLKTKRVLHILCIACVIGLSITGAHAQPLIYQCLFLTLYCIYRLFLMRSNTSDLPKIKIVMRDIPALLLTLIITFSSSSYFIFRHFSTIQEDSFQRRKFSFDELFQRTGELPKKYLTTLIFPDFFGTPAGRGVCFTPGHKPKLTYNNYNELCIYSGILPLFLMVGCIPYITRKKYVLFYFLSAFIPILMAMGSILYYPLAKYVPGLNLSTPTRILYLFGFSICVLAALGADILVREDKKSWGMIFLWTLVLLTAITLSLVVQTDTGIKWAINFTDSMNWNQVKTIIQNHFALSSPIISIPLGLVFMSFVSIVSIYFFKGKQSQPIFFVLSILILSYDLISFGRYYNTASPKNFEYPMTDAIQFLKDDTSKYRIITFGNFMHNSFAPFDIEDIGGYDSMYPKRYAEFLHLSQYGPAAPFPDNFSRWSHFSSYNSPLFDLLNVKYVLVPPSTIINMASLKLVYDNEIKIYENNNVFPRVFFVPSYQFCKNRQEAYKTISTYTAASDFKNKVVLEVMPPDEFKQVSNAANPIQSTINLISYNPNKIQVEVSTDQNGFIVLSDNYDPKWTVTVDGNPVKLYQANYIMRAFPIKTGTKQLVELTCYPKTDIIWLIITAVGWVTLILLIAISFIWDPSRKHTPKKV